MKSRVVKDIGDTSPGPRSIRDRSRSGVPLLVCVLLGIAPFLGGSEAHGQDRWATDFSKHTVPLDEIVSGGPPKDGIPAIDRPRFVSLDEAEEWLSDREPVVVVEHGGVARAYPYQILIYHEIVNDEVGGRPLSITFCPLCNTALVFERRHDGRVLDFGTTGRLRHSDLVMYDRQTESWWQQATGEAIVGDLAGDRLELYPAQTLNFEQFRQNYPGGEVLSRETGHSRPYGRNPYRGYDTQDGPIRSFFRKALDDRLNAMDRVAAVTVGETPVAYPFAQLARYRVVNDRVDGTPLVVFWVSGTASALDDGVIAEGRDVGSTGVFDRRVGERTLSFERSDDGEFVDRETGSRWNIAGRALEGPLAGTRLDPLPHGDYLWFAWSAFRPETEIREP